MDAPPRRGKASAHRGTRLELARTTRSRGEDPAVSIFASDFSQIGLALYAFFALAFVALPTLLTVGVCAVFASKAGPPAGSNLVAAGLVGSVAGSAIYISTRETMFSPAWYSGCALSAGLNVVFTGCTCYVLLRLGRNRS